MPRALKWNPPADGIVKINSDGAYTPGENYGGWGVIARTSQGEVVAARAGCSDGIHDPFTAELKAMEEALNLAAELGVIRVEFETDAQLLAMALNSKKPDCFSEAAVIEDIKIQCRTWFSYCQIRFGRRDSNQAAHELAKEGMKCNVNQSVFARVRRCQAFVDDCEAHPSGHDNPPLDRAASEVEATASSRPAAFWPKPPVATDAVAVERTPASACTNRTSLVDWARDESKSEACFNYVDNNSAPPDQANRELINLARRNHFEALVEERWQMPAFPSSLPTKFMQWARREAKSAVPRREVRSNCILGLAPTSTPPFPEPVDPLPYLSLSPATD
ncbi:hypothetical protein ZWY2020_034685 [Hordeum vulgare]|nr:hypothetical protein ZWY2020_034685 [Hordeum vulgare]